MCSKQQIYEFTKIYLSLFVAHFFLLFVSACSNSGSSEGLSDSSVTNSEYAYEKWPNETTTDEASNQILSKVLLSDLNQDGKMENIFISRLRGSTSPKSSILRITEGAKFKEIINFKSDRIHLLEDSIPFAFDFNKDGDSELVFVNYDRDQVLSFEFKEHNLKKMFIRWIVDLPEKLPEDFNRKIKIISFENKEMLQIGSFGIYEKNRKKIEVVVLSQ